MKGLGITVAALGAIQPRQVVEASGSGEMLWPQHLLTDRQGALMKGLGITVAALVPV